MNELTTNAEVAQEQPPSKPSRKQTEECPLCCKRTCESVYHRLTLANLPSGAKILWHFIRHHSSARGRSFPGYRRIAEFIHCDEQSITRWLSELEAKRWLSVKRNGRGRSNVYTVLDGRGKLPEFRNKSVGENPRTSEKRNRPGKPPHSGGEMPCLREPSTKEGKKDPLFCKVKGNGSRNSRKSVGLAQPLASAIAAAAEQPTAITVAEEFEIAW